MFKRVGLYLLFLAFVAQNPGNALESTVSDPALAKHVDAAHIEAFGTENSLRAIAQKAGIVIGVDGVRPEPEAETKFVLNFPGGTVADLLSAYTSQHRDWQWKEEKGAIHISRIGEHVTLGDVVLNYPEQKTTDRLDLWVELHLRPEVQSWMMQNNCRRGDPVPVHPLKLDHRTFVVPKGSYTVGQLLDDIARQSGANYWAILQSPKSVPRCSISVITW